MAKKISGPSKDKSSVGGKLSRRQVLKGAAAVAGAAAGSGAITGFPTIWAQEIKDIELRHVGVSYSVVRRSATRRRRTSASR
jgi:putative spermidine/putrescine transport system substrate-binding protein